MRGLILVLITYPIISLASGDCGDWDKKEETVKVCMIRNEKGLCISWGEKSCTYEIKCCERFGHPAACFERNRVCGPVRPI